MIILLLPNRFENMRIGALFVILIITALKLMAQSATRSWPENDSLINLSKNVLSATADSSRIRANQIFSDYYSKLLNNYQSVKLTADSLKMVSILTPSDSTFRIHTWTLPLNNGTYRYFGFVEFFSETYRLVRLVQTSGQALNEMKTYSPDEWYGALYTGLIVTKWNKQITYTLLGWDGRDARLNRKLIEILSFNSEGNLTFGQPVFKTPDGIKHRYVLDYAQNATVALRYDYQTIMMPKARRVKKVRDWMIVMDELAPLDPRMAGMKEYYVPSGTSYNAFAWMNGYWTFVENIEIGR